MAEIFLACEDNGDAGRRFVIVKRIKPGHASDPDFIEFFLTESRVSLKLTHPHLPQVFEHGIHDGLHYLAMEYIRGHNLLEIIRAAIKARKSLSVGAVLTLGIGVSAGLEHAHELTDVHGKGMNIVHRDVSPQNIMVSVSGVVKLIDFGIVRSAMQLHKTKSGIVKGKLAYMAPEQMEGSRHLDHRADLFALGIVMWETLIGRPLFRGASELDTVERIRRLEVPDPRILRPDIPAPVSAVILKALERDPDKRYPTATHMLTALEQVAEHVKMTPAMTRLRREMIDLCGVPAPPEVPARLLAGTSPYPAMVADLAPASAPDPDLPATSASESGLASDPLLLYFLRQAGAQLPDEPAVAAPADGLES